MAKNYQTKYPRQEIDELLALALHRPLSYLYKHPEKIISFSAIKAFNKLLKLRENNFSLAYLKGYKYFCNLKFLVNKHVLIPRPDSEIIITESLKLLAKIKNPKVLDIGTGSGCLIISLAKNYFPANYYAADISSRALTVAKTNARKHQVKIKFIKSNLLNKIPPIKFDLIIANLPYLTKAQLSEASIKQEPQLALFGGQEGLDHYQKLLKKIPEFLTDKGKLILEIDPGQTKKISEIIKKYLPTKKVSAKKDLSGLNRLMVIS